MSYREFFSIDANEFLRYWREGCSQRHIAREMGVTRKTVARYVNAAREMGLAPDGPEPTDGQIEDLMDLNRSGPRRPQARPRTC